jgi:hypothetical protein
MALVELEKLVADSNGEWEHTEFKKTTGELYGGMESLCAFLNGTGGRVFFGVTNAGRVLGQDMTDATFQEVANAIHRAVGSRHAKDRRLVRGGRPAAAGVRGGSGGRYTCASGPADTIHHCG